MRDVKVDQPDRSYESDRNYESETSESAAAFTAARKRLPTGVSRQTLAYAPYPLFAERGQAQYLWDLDGRRYTDFVNNYTSLIHGHAHPPTVDAAVSELRRGGALGAPTVLELDFARLLIERFPAIEQIRFALSGTEAITYALRCARAYSGRTRVLKFEGGFHGGHDETQQSITSDPMDQGTFGYGVPSSAGLMPTGTIVAIYNDKASVDAAFEAHGDEIAVVVVEPFLGNAGLVTAAPGFLQYVNAKAHECGALLLVDEIQSMRLAYGGALEIHDVSPDLVTLGKIMGGGLPLAAFGGRAEIMDVLDGFAPQVPQTGTFNAFSAALAAGMTTMRAFDRRAVKTLNATGEQLRHAAREIFMQRGLPATVNGQGSMFNICLADGPIDTYRKWRAAPTRLWAHVRMQLLADRHYITARGTGCLSTPMSDGDIERFLDNLGSALDTALEDDTQHRRRKE